VAKTVLPVDAQQCNDYLEMREKILNQKGCD